MSKAVLMSIQPKWCELIASGKKTVEVRKTRPKLKTPFKVYIYCTYGQGLIENNDLCYPNMLLDAKVSKNAIWGNCCNGKVIGEFVCDKIDGFNYGVHESYGASNWQDCYKGYPEELYDMESTCLSVKEINDYGNGRFLYTWNISNLVIYDKPKELSEFRLYDCRVEFENGYPIPTHTIKRPPQSWCYVEESDDN